MTTRILIATIPRSGSTWAFNAARLLLREKGPLHAAWIGDYDRDHPAPCHLVKLHQPDTLTFTPDCLIATRRALPEVTASLQRMGWLGRDEESLQKSLAHLRKLRAYWSERADLEIEYGDILEAPGAVLARMAALLGCAPTSPAAILASLEALSAPKEGGYDPETLLHPGHRTAHL